MEKVIERIKKMLAVANDNGASEGERDNAMRMAHAYLVKHNLDMEQVTSDVEDRVMEEDYLRQANDWSRSCMQSVSSLFFCKFIFWHDKVNQRDKNFFIGKKANAVTAREMSLFVVKSVNREGNRLRKEYNADSKFSRSFCEGATQRIYERCAEIREAAIKENEETQTSSSNALVLASFYEQEASKNEDFMKNRFGTSLTTNQMRARATDRAGFMMGKQYGDTINLNKQVKE